MSISKLKTELTFKNTPEPSRNIGKAREIIGCHLCKCHCIEEAQGALPFGSLGQCTHTAAVRDDIRWDQRFLGVKMKGWLVVVDSGSTWIGARLFLNCSNWSAMTMWGCPIMKAAACRSLVRFSRPATVLCFLSIWPRNGFFEKGSNHGVYSWVKPRGLTTSMPCIFHAPQQIQSCLPLAALFAGADQATAASTQSTHIHIQGFLIGQGSNIIRSKLDNLSHV